MEARRVARSERSARDARGSVPSRIAERVASGPGNALHIGKRGEHWPDGIGPGRFARIVGRAIGQSSDAIESSLLIARAHVGSIEQRLASNDFGEPQARLRIGKEDAEA